MHGRPASAPIARSPRSAQRSTASPLRPATATWTVPGGRRPAGRARRPRWSPTPQSAPAGPGPRRPSPARRPGGPPRPAPAARPGRRAARSSGRSRTRPRPPRSAGGRPGHVDQGRQPPARRSATPRPRPSAAPLDQRAQHAGGERLVVLAADGGAQQLAGPVPRDGRAATPSVPVNRTRTSPGEARYASRTPAGSAASRGSSRCGDQRLADARPPAAAGCAARAASRPGGAARAPRRRSTIARISSGTPGTA